MNLLFRLVFIFLLLNFPVCSQESDANLIYSTLDKVKTDKPQESDANLIYSTAIAYIESGDYQKAYDNFEEILMDSGLISYHPEALYWLVKIGIVIRLYTEAADYADLFMSNFKSSDYYPEIYYHRARLYLFENQPMKSLNFLESFINNYPMSSLIPSSYYWKGEAFIKLGELESAQKTFNDLLKNFPANVKRESASFRIKEIKLQLRENELLEILKSSHANYLDVTAKVYLKGQENQRLAQLRIENENEMMRKQELKNRLLETKSQIVELRKYYISELLRLSDEY